MATTPNPTGKVIGCLKNRFVNEGGGEGREFIVRTRRDGGREGDGLRTRVGGGSRGRERAGERCDGVGASWGLGVKWWKKKSRFVEVDAGGEKTKEDRRKGS